jgi:hypothetical protein
MGVVTFSLRLRSSRAGTHCVQAPHPFRDLALLPVRRRFPLRGERNPERVPRSGALRAPATSPELSGVSEGSPAAGALAVVPVDQGRERGRLGQGHGVAGRQPRQRGRALAAAQGGQELLGRLAVFRKHRRQVKAQAAVQAEAADGKTQFGQGLEEQRRRLALDRSPEIELPSCGATWPRC